MRIEDALKGMNEITEDSSDVSHRFEMSILWIRIQTGSEPDKISSVSYRIESALHLPDGNNWKRIPGYCESFHSQVLPEDTEYDGLHDGILNVLGKAYSLAIRKNEVN